MSEVTHLLHQANKSLRLALAHTKRAFSYYIKALFLAPRLSGAKVAAGVATSLDTVLTLLRATSNENPSSLAVFGRWTLVILLSIFRPFFYIATFAIRVVAFIIGLIYAAVVVGFVLVGFAYAGLLLFFIAKGIFVALAAFDSALRQLPTPENTAGWHGIVPYFQYYGIFAVLVPLVCAIIAVVVLSIIVLLLISFVPVARELLVRTSRALAQSASNTWHSTLKIIRGWSWRHIFILSLVLCGCAAAVWSFQHCTQSDTCRQASPWVLLVVIVLILLIASDVTPNEGKGFSIKIGGCSFISVNENEIAIFGVSLISVALVSISVPILVLFSYAAISWSPVAGRWLVAAIEPPPPSVEAPNTRKPVAQPHPGHAMKAADTNLFLSSAYWRPGSGLELTNRFGNRIELENVSFDQETLCGYVFIMAVGAASPDGPEVLNNYFSRRRAQSTALIVRNKIEQCDKHIPVIASSLGESIAGIPAIETRKLLAFGIKSAGNEEISTSVLDEPLAEFLHAAVSADIDTRKLQPEYCIYDGMNDEEVSAPLRFSLETCKRRW